jgi:protein SCO1
MSSKILFGILGLVLGVCAIACQRDDGAYEAANQSDCLPALKMVDQNGKLLELASLKGKFVLVDFLYTSCPGACLMLTQKMSTIAQSLGPILGRDITLLSVDIDPEHDGPAQLEHYVHRQDAQFPGWRFVTGQPATIDLVLRNFQLRRQREADGSVAHVEGIFLLGPDGKERREYDGKIVRAGIIEREIRQSLALARQSASP